MADRLITQTFPSALFLLGSVAILPLIATNGHFQINLN